MSRRDAQPTGGGMHAVSLRGPWGAVAVALGVTMGAAITVGTDQAGVARPLGFIAGGFVAALTVGALPSFSKRVVIPAVLGLGGFVLIRHAQLGVLATDLSVLFVVGAVVTTVLAERARGADAQRVDSDVHPWRGVGTTLATLTVLIAIVGALIAPVVSAASHRDVRSGDDPNPFADSATSALLSASNTMDTRARPRLSDRMVLTVEAQRPSFWRGATYDQWDGHTWTGTAFVHRPSALVPGVDGWDSVVAAPEDIAVDLGVENTQTFTIKAPYSEVMYAAPTAVRVKSNALGGQWPDANLIAGRPLGAGATYTVVSRQPNATQATLEAVTNERIPEIVRRNNFDASALSERTRDLARRITRDAATPYAKVRAITDWLGANTEYSLDAPLPPSDSDDTVDYYLFESKQAWCEQISSALALMLREVGVPARIATGFATGEFDPLTGRYIVRERDAHAWTEVYFDGIGWQGFDPTARVPLAGEPPPERSVVDWLQRNIVWLIVLAAAIAVMVAAAHGVRRAWRDRRRRRNRSWAATMLDELEALGRKARRPRAPNETVCAYAGALAQQCGVPDISQVGALIDEYGYGCDRSPPPEVQQQCRDTVAAAGRAL